MFRNSCPRRPCSVVLHPIRVLFEPNSRPFCPRLSSFCARFVPDSCPIWFMCLYFTCPCCLVLYLYFICPFQQSMSLVCVHFLVALFFIFTHSFLSPFLSHMSSAELGSAFAMFLHVLRGLLSCARLSSSSSSCCVFIGRFVRRVSRQLDSETRQYLSQCTS